MHVPDLPHPQQGSQICAQQTPIEPSHPGLYIKEHCRNKRASPHGAGLGPTWYLRMRCSQRWRVYSPKHCPARTRPAPGLVSVSAQTSSVVKLGCPPDHQGDGQSR